MRYLKQSDRWIAFFTLGPFKAHTLLLLPRPRFQLQPSALFLPSLSLQLRFNHPPNIASTLRNASPQQVDNNTSLHNRLFHHALYVLRPNPAIPYPASPQRIALQARGQVDDHVAGVLVAAYVADYADVCVYASPVQVLAKGGLEEGSQNAAALIATAVSAD